MSNSPKNNLSGNASDEQAARKNLSREFDHDLANKPLTQRDIIIRKRRSGNELK